MYNSMLSFQVLWSWAKLAQKDHGYVYMALLLELKGLDANLQMSLPPLKGSSSVWMYTKVRIRVPGPKKLERQGTTNLRFVRG